MDKQTIITIIKTEKPYLMEQFGVEKIGLFGSYARNEADKNSDIDIFVELKSPSYNSLMGLYAYLETLMNSKVDIVRNGNHLSSYFKQQIEKDLIYA